jgi:hypothetical protein
LSTARCLIKIRVTFWYSDECDDVLPARTVHPPWSKCPRRKTGALPRMEGKDRVDAKQLGDRQT